LLQWYLLNRTTEIVSSPSTTLMKSLSELVFKVITVASAYEEISKISVEELIKQCKKQDQLIMELYQ